MSMPSPLAIIPFIALLSMIATGPLLYAHFWHRFYRYISVGLGATVVIYYAILGDMVPPICSMVEYIQFILLIGALYMVAGNVLIKLGCTPKPVNNIAILWSGAVLANLIGTTGASMLLIRPYMQLNRKRLQPYHIVFFIFIVSNVGGALTPMADPPLFLGFLKGIPFFWTLKNNLLPWLLALTLLSMLFYWFDEKNKKKKIKPSNKQPSIHIAGKRYGVLFLLIVAILFLDPNQIMWLPSIPFHGHKLSFVRELILLLIIIAVYIKRDKKILAANKFSFEPLSEVVFVFMGIFATMTPAITLIGKLAEEKSAWINPSTLYWGTGILSSFLDNAPTFLNFLAAGMSAKGLSIAQIAEVVAYSQNYINPLRATSIAAVFFGAMTYIGNGPNFMVRAIAEEQGVKMPSFFGYMARFSLLYLLPIVSIVWLVFIFANIGV